MKDLSLQDSLTYAAFGTFDIPFAEQYKEQDKIQNAKAILRKAFIAGKVRVFSDNTDLPIKDTYGFDWIGNRIFATTGQYFTDECAKNNIKVCAEDLFREFPSNHKHTLVKPHKKEERPERRVIHDIAFYFWENNKQLQAKQLHQKTCLVLQTYLEFAAPDKDPITLSTMQKWLSEFRAGKYTPATEKHKLSAQYRDIFSKLRNAQ